MGRGREEGRKDQTRPEKHRLAKGNGTKPNHSKVRQGKGQKKKGNCIKPPRGVANSWTLGLKMSNNTRGPAKDRGSTK